MRYTESTVQQVKTQELPPQMTLCLMKIGSEYLKDIFLEFSQQELVSFHKGQTIEHSLAHFFFEERSVNESCLAILQWSFTQWVRYHFQADRSQVNQEVDAYFVHLNDLMTVFGSYIEKQSLSLPEIRDTLDFLISRGYDSVDHSEFLGAFNSFITVSEDHAQEYYTQKLSRVLEIKIEGNHESSEKDAGGDVEAPSFQTCLVGPGLGFVLASSKINFKVIVQGGEDVDGLYLNTSFLPKEILEEAIRTGRLTIIAIDGGFSPWPGFIAPVNQSEIPKLCQFRATVEYEGLTHKIDVTSELIDHHYPHRRTLPATMESTLETIIRGLDCDLPQVIFMDYPDSDTVISALLLFMETVVDKIIRKENFSSLNFSEEDSMDFWREKIRQEFPVLDLVDEHIFEVFSSYLTDNLNQFSGGFFYQIEEQLDQFLKTKYTDLRLVIRLLGAVDRVCGIYSKLVLEEALGVSLNEQNYKAIVLGVEKFQEKYLEPVNKELYQKIKNGKGYQFSSVDLMNQFLRVFEGLLELSNWLKGGLVPKSEIFKSSDEMNREYRDLGRVDSLFWIGDRICCYNKEISGSLARAEIFSNPGCEIAIDYLGLTADSKGRFYRYNITSNPGCSNSSLDLKDKIEKFLSKCNHFIISNLSDLEEIQLLNCFAGGDGSLISGNRSSKNLQVKPELLKELLEIGLACNFDTARLKDDLRLANLLIGTRRLYLSKKLYS